MKAKEYYAKYSKGIYEECLRYENDPEDIDWDSPSVVSDLFADMVTECRNIISSRHSTKNEIACEVIKEQNQKWNVMCRMFKKEYGREVMKKDGLLDYFAARIPHLKEYMEKKERAKNEKKE